MLLKTADALRTSGKQKRESLSQKKKKKGKGVLVGKSHFMEWQGLCARQVNVFFFF